MPDNPLMGVESIQSGFSLHPTVTERGFGASIDLGSHTMPWLICML